MATSSEELRVRVPRCNGANDMRNRLQLRGNQDEAQGRRFGAGADSREGIDSRISATPPKGG